MGANFSLLAMLINLCLQMDKTSIIGDAVLYVQDLQMQAKKLKAEIAGLEALMAGYQEESINNPVKIRVARNNHPICKKILKVLKCIYRLSCHLINLPSMESKINKKMLPC